MSRLSRSARLAPRFLYSFRSAVLFPLLVAGLVAGVVLWNRLPRVLEESAAQNLDAALAFAEGRPALLDWEYGLEIVRLTLAAYLSAERGHVVDLTDPATCRELEDYTPLIQQGRGAELLGVEG